MTVTADPAVTLMSGPLGRAGGVAVVDNLPGPDTCRALLLEAQDSYRDATRQSLPHGDGAEGRGGMPERSLSTAGGGAVQDRLYADPRMADYVSRCCGTAVVPTGNRGSYSYYLSPGDFLGLHRDVDLCDVTLITVLHDDTSPSDPAGGLVVYRGQPQTSLSQIRGQPHQGADLVKARAGQSILILGGMVPHRVVPIGSSGTRVISALCFTASF